MRCQGAEAGLYIFTRLFSCISPPYLPLPSVPLFPPLSSAPPHALDCCRRGPSGACGRERGEVGAVRASYETHDRLRWKYSLINGGNRCWFFLAVAKCHHLSSPPPLKQVTSALTTHHHHHYFLLATKTTTTRFLSCVSSVPLYGVTPSYTHTATMIQILMQMSPGFV